MRTPSTLGSGIQPCCVLKTLSMMADLRWMLSAFLRKMHHFLSTGPWSWAGRPACCCGAGPAPLLTHPLLLREQGRGQPSFLPQVPQAASLRERKRKCFISFQSRPRYFFARRRDPGPPHRPFPTMPLAETKSHVTGGAGSPSWRLPAAAGLSPAGRAAGPKPGPGPDRRFCGVPRRTPKGCTWRWSGARSATPRAAASPAPSASRAATSSSSTAATPRGTGGPEGTGRGGTGHPLPPLPHRPGLGGGRPASLRPALRPLGCPSPAPLRAGCGGHTRHDTVCLSHRPPPTFPAVQPLSRGGGLWVWGGGTVLPLPGPLWGCLLGGGAAPHGQAEQDPQRDA